MASYTIEQLYALFAPSEKPANFETLGIFGIEDCQQPVGPKKPENIPEYSPLKPHSEGQFHQNKKQQQPRQQGQDSHSKNQNKETAKKPVFINKVDVAPGMENVVFSWGTKPTPQKPQSPVASPVQPETPSPAASTSIEPPKPAPKPASTSKPAPSWGEVSSILSKATPIAEAPKTKPKVIEPVKEVAPEPAHTAEVQHTNNHRNFNNRPFVPRETQQKEQPAPEPPVPEDPRFPSLGTSVPKKQNKNISAWSNLKV